MSFAADGAVGEGLGAALWDELFGLGFGLGGRLVEPAFRAPYSARLRWRKVAVIRALILMPSRVRRSA